MTLTLLKSGILPNPTTDQEEHWFTYALYPHEGDCYAADVQREAYCLNVPVYAARVELQPGAELQPIPQNLMRIDAENVVIETVKQAESGVGTIIRVYEDHNRRTNARIVWHKEYLSAVECDLMENEIAKPVLSSRDISFTIKPFEIKTFKIIE